ncbi:MAG: Ca2+-dependent phosphoinositide-specific phospholipase C [Pseudomonadales bacterium]
MTDTRWILLLLACWLTTPVLAAELTVNQLQFIGSHNSYKQAMSPEHAQALRARNPAAADSLEYAHLPLPEQLDLGLRKLELDIFYQPQTGSFVVGHVQVIDMNSHCNDLGACLEQIKAWSDANPRHAPLWISFNTKDQAIEGLPDPSPFAAEALKLLDQHLQAALGDRLIWPSQVRPAGSDRPVWPPLDEARGKILLILDEGGDKRANYMQGWRERPMFMNVPPEHPASAIQIINDPLAQGELIRQRVVAGFMVRTRADADTVEARADSTARREAALASGAQAVSTDYYLPAVHFGNDYQVRIEGGVRCNPVTAPADCTVSED